MKIVIFGLSISSSWGNGHATLWRGLCKELARRGHRVVFYEKDTPYYRDHRDLVTLPGCDVKIYPDWHSIRAQVRNDLQDCDVGMVTSYCPDAIAAGYEICESRALSAFYDLDTPVTLLTWEREGSVPYIARQGLVDFDVVFSYTGGSAISKLTTQFGARNVYPLYGSADPECHAPTDTPVTGDLSYLGTYAADRQDKLDELFLEPARQRPESKFILGGAQYPGDFPWHPNIFFRRHVPPGGHPAFYCSSRLTLNITRASMANLGYCPSGRLFEAAACGVPIITDLWVGLTDFFHPGREILPAVTTGDVLEAIQLTDHELKLIGKNGRERTLAEHTAAHRALEMERVLDAVVSAETVQTQHAGL